MYWQFFKIDDHEIYILLAVVVAAYIFIALRLTITLNMYVLPLPCFIHCLIKFYEFFVLPFSESIRIHLVEP
jgi:hypothetical protein